MYTICLDVIPIPLRELAGHILGYSGGLEELGVPPESFNPEFLEQIRSFLISRHAV